MNVRHYFFFINKKYAASPIPPNIRIVLISIPDDCGITAPSALYVGVGFLPKILPNRLPIAVMLVLTMSDVVAWVGAGPGGPGGGIEPQFSDPGIGFPCSSVH
jgi:hypothetical protein